MDAKTILAIALVVFIAGGASATEIRSDRGGAAYFAAPFLYGGIQWKI